MSLSKDIALQFRTVYFGGNWTAVNLKDTLSGINSQQAIANVYQLNTVAALTFHIHYYVNHVLKVLQGAALQASDKFSFDHPPISSDQDWQMMINHVLKEGELFASHIEMLGDVKLFEDFVKTEYGSYYRNLQGIIEHAHYHLGQIVVIKKILQADQQL